MITPVVYTAGPYRASTRKGIELNIQAARAVALLACRKGWSVICPHANTGHLDAIDPTIGDEFWLASTMELLLRVNPGLYAHHEAKQEQLMADLPTARPFLRMVRSGKTQYLTLREFREYIETGGQIELFEHGGCGCFSEAGACGFSQLIATDNDNTPASATQEAG